MCLQVTELQKTWSKNWLKLKDKKLKGETNKTKIIAGRF